MYDRAVKSATWMCGITKIFVVFNTTIGGSHFWHGSRATKKPVAPLPSSCAERPMSPLQAPKRCPPGVTPVWPRDRVQWGHAIAQTYRFIIASLTHLEHLVAMAAL